MNNPRDLSPTNRVHCNSPFEIKFRNSAGSESTGTIYYIAIAIAASLGVGAHSYADDSQLYLHFLAIDRRSAALRLAECIERVEGWMKSNWLRLNSDKTQFMWLIQTAVGEDRHKDHDDG